MPPTAVATTGRDFHIASATVSPKPSAMLFWTTTSAARWSALTITAFSSASSSGRQTRWTLRRAASSSPSRSVFASSSTSLPSGSSETSSTAGPA